jgi:hypothetical protein
MERSPGYLRCLGVAITLLILGNVLDGQAETLPHTKQFSDRIRVVYNPPPLGAPGDMSNAGSRTNCPAAATPFTALSPATTNWGETLDSHPTFWLYLPYVSGQVRLTLTDEITEDVVYQTTFQATDGPGIGQFSMPDTAPSLEVDRLYRWQFSLTCPSGDEAGRVDGIIVRRSPAPPFTAQLQTASPQERVALYAAQGLWYNALDAIADLHQAYPQNPALEANWSSLLQSPGVELGILAPEPLINCCTATPVSPN